MARKMRDIGKMDIHENDSFSKYTLTVGEGDSMPNEGSVCVVGLTLLDVELNEMEMGGYKVADRTEVTIGEGDCFISDHIDKVVLTMKAGEACYVKSKVDYQGMVGEGKNVFKFNLFLYSFERAADHAELHGDERLEHAQLHKDKGTELFKRDNIEYAMKRYERALVCLGGRGESRKLPGELPQQHKTLILQCHLNLAAALLKRADYEGVARHCSEALEVDADSVKGLFRRGQAYLKLSKLKEARADFAAVVALEVSNKAAKRELSAVDVLIKREKQMYQKMFS